MTRNAPFDTVGKSVEWWVKVSKIVFQGASALSLDAKGRLSVPTRHRDVLSATAQGQLTITKHPHGCLMVFPRPEWEKFRERIAQLPMSAQWWKRIFLGNAMDVEMDGTGRVLISPELRQAAGRGNPARVAAHHLKDEHLGGRAGHGAHVEGRFPGGYRHVLRHRAEAGADRKSVV